MLLAVLSFLVSAVAGTETLIVERLASRVKLHNHGSVSVDVSGWRVDGEDGFRHVFPRGTVIPAYEFIVVHTKESARVKVLNSSDEMVAFVGEISPTQLQIEKKGACPTEPSVARRLYTWFDPKIRMNSNMAHPEQTTKVVEGVADQRFCEPLTVGLGGKWVKRPDETEAYVGLTDLKLSLKEFGNLSVHHQHLLAGVESGDHPQKTTLSWRIPAVLGLTLSLNREHRWSDEFKADLNSVGVERPIGGDVIFYTKHCVQSFGSGLTNGHSMVGLRNTATITGKLKLITHAELWRNAQSDQIYYKMLSSSLQYFSSELRRIVITMRANRWKHEFNPVLQLTVVQPIVAGIHLGARSDMNYHVPKVTENWHHFKRCAGIAYVPRPNSRLKVIGNVEEVRTQWQYRWQVNSYKLIVSPLKTVTTSLRYAHSGGSELGSAWVKYLHTYFELGVGGRALRSEESIRYGLTMEGGIRRFQRLPLVCAYRVGYNLISLDDQVLVRPLYRNPCYYVKLVISPNSFESLFEEE